VEKREVTVQLALSVIFLNQPFTEPIR